MAVKTSATVSRRQAIQHVSEHLEDERTLRRKTVGEGSFEKV